MLSHFFLSLLISSPYKDKPHIEVTRPILEKNNSAEEPLLEQNKEQDEEEEEGEQGTTAAEPNVSPVATLLKKVSSGSEC